MYNNTVEKKFIYFDVGNTLIDCSTAFHNAALKFNLTAEDIGSVFDENHDEITKGTMSSQEFWEKCIQKFNLQRDENFNFLESWVSDYKPIYPMHNLLYKIRSQYRIGLLSNIYKGMRPIIFKKNLIPHIDYESIIFSCDVKMMKPDREIYQLARKKAGVNMEDILFVDDRADFLETAKNLGGQIFLFNDMEAKKSVKELEKYLKNF